MVNLVKKVAIIQARVGSTRLPSKVIKDICNKPMLWHIIQRVRESRFLDEVIVATTKKKEDDVIIDLCEKENVSFYRGSDQDVLDRFYRCAKQYESDIIVRITADDPFKDPRIIDSLIKIFIENNYDFVSNTISKTFPDGLDVEIFSFKVLKYMWKNAKTNSHREHVTGFVLDNLAQFKTFNYLIENKNLSYLRLTVDTEKDFLYAEKIYNELYPKKKIFLMDDILNLIKKNPELKKFNNCEENYKW